MKFDKVGTNTYRVRKTYKGKTYTIYFDHEPDEPELFEAISEKLQEANEDDVKSSFGSCCDMYIKTKSNILSPSTIGGYKKIKRSLSASFKHKKISEITSIDIQKEINDYAAKHSPKSVRNLHGFISAVLRTYRPKFNFSTSLPQKKKFNRYMPTEDEVKKILDASKGTPYHIGFQLAVLGMRRSEICGASVMDLKDNILTINKARIYDENNHLMTRDNTKTEDSTREIYLPDALVEEIKEAGVICDKTPPMLVKTLHKLQDELGIPRFRLHDFRGFYVSYAHSLGVPDVYILKAGGWKSDFVMKNTYRDALRDKNEEMQKKISDNIFGGL